MSWKCSSKDIYWSFILSYRLSFSRKPNYFLKRSYTYFNGLKRSEKDLDAFIPLRVLESSWKSLRDVLIHAKKWSLHYRSYYAEKARKSKLITNCQTGKPANLRRVIQSHFDVTKKYINAEDFLKFNKPGKSWIPLWRCFLFFHSSVVRLITIWPLPVRVY